jgi:HEAT repeat protein
MRAAEAAMLRRSLSAGELSDLELCWAISSEDETLADFAGGHLERCWGVLRQLAASRRQDVRWQVFSVLASAGPRAEGLLRAGLDDPDPYARRRALLSLAHLAPANARQLAERFLRDPDPYLRQAAIEMARAAHDARFMREAVRQLREDDVEHVHEAAAALARSGGSAG